MFTQVKPTVRHITPDDLNGRTLVKVVYVVLEPQYQSSLSAAVRSINKSNPDVAIEIIGYLIEELRSPENYEAFKKDIAEANIFIASLIFIEDLADKLVEAVQPHRDHSGCGDRLPLHAPGHAPQQTGHLLHGATGPIQERDRPIHEKAQGAIWRIIPRWNAEAAAHPAQGAEVSARGKGPGCPQLYVGAAILAGGF